MIASSPLHTVRCSARSLCFPMGLLTPQILVTYHCIYMIEELKTEIYPSRHAPGVCYVVSSIVALDQYVISVPETGRG